jgi:hypothetical protein
MSRPALPRQWIIIGCAAAVAWAGLIAWHVAPRIAEAGREARTRLIQETRLWESDPQYPGTPKAWTYFAAWLLTDGQLLERVHARMPERADAIEADYERDRFLALAPIVLAAAGAWAAPIGAVAAGLWWRRRRRR